jgi:hypothetical protein
MGPKVVSESDMPSILLAIGRTEIKVMWKIVRWSAEGLPAGNAQIAPVFIAQ